MKLRAKVLLAGKTATGIRVPTQVLESLGPCKRPPVRVTINGYTYRSSVSSLVGAYMIGISADDHDQARVAACDHDEVKVELDTDAREVAVPADFAAVLKRDAVDKRFF